MTSIFLNLKRLLIVNELGRNSKYIAIVILLKRIKKELTLDVNKFTLKTEAPKQEVSVP